MGGAVFADVDSGVGRGYLDIGMPIGNLLAELVIDAPRNKLGKGADERDLACNGESCSNSYHI